MENRLEAFKDNPKVNLFHFTEDGIPFANRGDAVNHAAVLKKAGKGNGKITPITRAQAEQMLAKAGADSGSQETDSKGKQTSTNPVLTPKQLAEQLVAEKSGALIQALTAQENAKLAITAAQTAKDGLGAEATATQKTAATKAVNAAIKALELADAGVAAAEVEKTAAEDALRALDKPAE